MIHTDEDDEFDRILRENRLKGQPYHWEADAIKAAVLIEREACAKVCEETTASWTQHLYNEGCIDCAKAIRARGQA
jgi:hypothetical protein